MTLNSQGSPALKVRRVSVTEKDENALKNANGRAVQASQPESYRNRVVLKPWGFEFLIFENQDSAVWFLHIKKGFSTSLHCHPKKKTALILLKGKAFCNTLNERFFLEGRGALIFEKGVFHSTKALSDGGIDVIEVESPPGKTDLVRLDDGYGRGMSGYEGISEMISSGLEQFGYFDLSPVAGPSASGCVTKHDEYSVSLNAYSFGDQILAVPSAENDYGRMFCVCSGGLSFDGVKNKVGIGDIFLENDLKEPFKISDNQVLLLQVGSPGDSGA